LKSIAKKSFLFWVLAFSMMFLPFAQADTTTKPTANQADTKTAVVETVNINTADQKTLARLLKGVGPKKAKAIVAYRKAYRKKKADNPFKKPADIMKVRGIGKKTFEKNKDKIRVSDEQTNKPTDATQSKPQSTPPPKDKNTKGKNTKGKDKNTKGKDKNTKNKSTR
jgi:competence protein ComEA